jgi:hypothetical protein
MVKRDQHTQCDTNFSQSDADAHQINSALCLQCSLQQGSTVSAEDCYTLISLTMALHALGCIHPHSHITAHDTEEHVCCYAPLEIMSHERGKRDPSPQTGRNPCRCASDSRTRSAPLPQAVCGIICSRPRLNRLTWLEVAPDALAEHLAPLLYEVRVLQTRHRVCQEMESSSQ